MAWETKRIKDVFSFSKGLSITKENLVEKGVPVISYGQIHSKQNKGVKIDDSLIRFVGEEYLESGEKSLTNKHDFIFADTSEDLEGCGNNVYVDRDMTLFAGYHTIMLRNKKPQDCRYFAYQFNSDSWRTQIRKTVCGIKVFSITQKGLSNISLLVPPETTQQKIADFLDAKTQNIDARIELLEKKKEYYTILRKALINEAVNGEGKNWETLRVKDLFDIGRGRVIGQETLEDGGEYPVYSSQTENDGCLGYISTFDFEGDYLTWTTDGVNAGTIFKRSGKFNCTNICGTLKQKRNNCDLLFMYYALSVVAQHNKRIDTNGAKIMNNEMAIIQLPFPSIQEQIKIAKYLEKKTLAIDSIVGNITTEIDSLKTYRRALINEAVTGKLDIE